MVQGAVLHVVVKESEREEVQVCMSMSKLDTLHLQVLEVMADQKEEILQNLVRILLEVAVMAMQLMKGVLGNCLLLEEVAVEG